MALIVPATELADTSDGARQSMNNFENFENLGILLLEHPDLTALFNTSGVIVVYADGSFIIVPDSFRGTTKIPATDASFIRYITATQAKNGAGYVGEANQLVEELVNKLGRPQEANSWRFGTPGGAITNLDGKVLQMDTCGSELVFDDDRNPVVIRTVKVGNEYEITIADA